MPFNLGGPELIIVLVIILIDFGAGKLPEVGSALGRGVREFRAGATEADEKAKAAAQVATASSEKTCASCNAVNQADSRFCRQCGAALTA